MEENRNYDDECGDHGGTNSRGEPCGRAAGWGTDFESGKCRVHRGTSPDGSSHEGNSNAEGNSGGAAPEGNFNNLKTGENVAVDRWIEFVNEEADEEFKQLFRGQYERFIDRGADPMVATRLAVLWSKADFNNMELIKEGFTRPMYHEGEYVDDVFDDQRDSSAIKNEREARMFRREEKLSPYSRDDDVAQGLESIAEILGETTEDSA